MDIGLSGKRILVTGAGQGIGRAIVKKLAACQAHVIALSRTESYLESLKKECPGIDTVVVDLSNWQATRDAIEKIGAVQLLVNNAAVTSVKPFLEVKEEDINLLMSVNVKAVINVSQVVIKGMLERGEGGAIVNLSSKASMIGLKDHTVYCASKSALDSITRVMALEFGPRQIRVNAVNPTVVMTPMGREVWSDPVVAAPVLSRIPMGRFADEEDVVNAVLYLLSDKAGMINGVTLPIDGGFLAS